MATGAVGKRNPDLGIQPVAGTVLGNTLRVDGLG